MKQMSAILLAAVLISFSIPASAKVMDERIYLIPAGKIDRKVLEDLKERIPGLLPISAGVAIDPGQELSSEGYDTSRKQYSAEMALAHIAARTTIDTSNECVLIITDADLYTQGSDQTFGFADAKKVMSVLSLARLKNEFYGLKPDERSLHDRVLKEALYGLGRSWGLGDCKNPRCVMYFSKEVSDIDKKQNRLCVECDKSLRHRYSNSLFGSLALW